MNTKEQRNNFIKVLNIDSLVKEAKIETGLSDFDDEHFIEPLKKLLECVANDVDFHEQGLAAFKFSIVRCLVNRLRFAEDLKEHPEILEEDVSDPIIIIGLGRSGTTKLQKMLSAPDEVQKTTFWRLWNPAPFPDTKASKPDPRIQAANFSELMSEGNENLDAAHHMTYLEVEEDGLLYFLTFEDWLWSIMTPTDSFYNWVMDRSNIEAYRYVKKMFQYLQWQDGGKRNRPWIIKSIAHTANMDALMECYPNATLVHAHRDPMQTIPSWAKFQAELWCLQSKPIDLSIAGERTMKYYKIAIDRYLEARERLNLDKKIVDVQYVDIRSNPMKVMHEVYRQAGLTMSVEAEKKMSDWDKNNEQGKFGRHSYSLEEFEITPEMINETFQGYIARYIER